MNKTLIILTSILFLGLNHTIFAQNKSFVPTDFIVLDTLESDNFRIRMLSINDVVKDYDAEMSSIEHLKKMFPTSSWPFEKVAYPGREIDCTEWDSMD